jgi:hypothetical protein
MDFAPSVQHHRRLRANARPITLNPLNQGVKKEYRCQTINNTSPLAEWATFGGQSSTLASRRCCQNFISISRHLIPGGINYCQITVVLCFYSGMV